MRLAIETDIDDIVCFLRENIDDCIYLYIDIKKYRLTNPAMSIWIGRTKDGKIDAVVMKYHTSITFFTDNIERIESIVKIINFIQPNSISSTKKNIGLISNKTKIEYNQHYGFVVKYNKFRDYGGKEIIEEADINDMHEIASLIMSDAEIGSYYEIKDFAQQLSERKTSGIGRNYVIRDGNRIVAHVATYAEFEDIAVGGGLIVDPLYKDRMYGAMLESFLVRTMLGEGRNYYGFVDERHMKVLTRMGNECVAEYGKLSIEVK